MYPFRSKIRISLSSRGVVTFQATTCCSPAQRDPTESVVATVFLLLSPFLPSPSLWDTCTRKCSLALSTASKRPPPPCPPRGPQNLELSPRRTTLATTRVCVSTTHVLHAPRARHVMNENKRRKCRGNSEGK